MIDIVYKHNVLFGVWFWYLDFLLCRAHCEFVWLLRVWTFDKSMETTGAKFRALVSFYHNPLPLVTIPLFQANFPRPFLKFYSFPPDFKHPIWFHPVFLFTINPSLLGWCLVVYPPNYRLIAYVYLICYGSRESSAKHSLSSRLKRHTKGIIYFQYMKR